MRTRYEVRPEGILRKVAAVQIRFADEWGLDPQMNVQIALPITATGKGFGSLCFVWLWVIYKSRSMSYMESPKMSVSPICMQFWLRACEVFKERRSARNILQQSVLWAHQFESIIVCVLMGVQSHNTICSRRRDKFLSCCPMVMTYRCRSPVEHAPWGSLRLVI